MIGPIVDYCTGPLLAIIRHDEIIASHHGENHPQSRYRLGKHIPLQKICCNPYLSSL